MPRSPPISVNLPIELDSADFLTTEPIKGKILFSTSADLSIESVSVFVEGCFVSTVKGKEVVEVFYESPETILAKPERARSVLVFRQGPYTFPFSIPPLNIQPSTSCIHPEKYRVSWAVIAKICVPKQLKPLRSARSFAFHVGHQLAIQRAPNSTVTSKQSFLSLRANPILYRIALHKSVFIPGETVSMTLAVKNQSNRDLICLRTELHQLWTSKRGPDKVISMKFEINSHPIFPLRQQSEKEHVLQFNLPPTLTPTIFNEGKLTPVQVSYALHLTFVSERQDNYSFDVPINIEDNFPPRAPETPPEPPRTPAPQQQSFSERQEPAMQTNPPPMHQYYNSPPTAFATNVASQAPVPLPTSGSQAYVPPMAYATQSNPQAEYYGKAITPERNFDFYSHAEGNQGDSSFELSQSPPPPYTVPPVQQDMESPPPYSTYSMMMAGSAAPQVPFQPTFTEVEGQTYQMPPPQPEFYPSMNNYIPVNQIPVANPSSLYPQLDEPSSN